MPSPLVFVACEKVILDDDKNPSLISVLQQVNLAVPTADKIPDNAAAPLRWCLFTLWLQQPGDEGRRFQQVCEATLPDGRTSVVARTEFEVSHRTHQIKLEIFGFPIPKVAGECVFRLYLAEEGRERREVASYPISVRHKS